MNYFVLLGIDISKNPFDYMGAQDSAENVKKISKIITFGADWFSLLKVASIVGLLLSFGIIIIRSMLAKNGAERGEHKQIIGYKFIIFMAFCGIGTIMTVAQNLARAFM